MKHKTKITIASIVGLLAVGGIAYAAQEYRSYKKMHRVFDPQKIMKQVDSNGDQAASREEVESVSAKYFAKADGDGNGQLTKAEIIIAVDGFDLPSKAKKHSGRFADRLMQKADINQDGLLELDEVKNRMTKFHTLADWDDNGKVEMAEIKRLRSGFGHRRYKGKRN